MENIFISIVLPIYKVEAYLPRCVDSILATGLPDMEIILVDDGSPDGCPAICDAYAEQDARISVIHQPNGGISLARNAGMRQAHGEYIIFIDSDDYIIPNVFIGVVDKLRNLTACVDMLFCDFVRVASDGAVIYNSNQIEPTKEIICDNAYLSRLLAHGGAYWNTWRFVFSRQFLLTNGLFFLSGYYCEDVDHTLRALGFRPKMAFYHAPFYRYFVFRADSIMSTVSSKRISDLLTIMQQRMHAVLDSPDYPCREQVITSLQVEFSFNLATIVETKSKDRGSVEQLFREAAWIMKDSKNLMVRISQLMMRCCGLRVTAHLLHFIKILRRRLRSTKASLGCRQTKQED